MRIAAALGIVLALSCVVGALSWPVDFPLETGAPYNVAVQGTQATFDLPSSDLRSIDLHSIDLRSDEKRTGYLLIVANLSRDPLPRTVTLSIEPSSGPSARILQRIDLSQAAAPVRDTAALSQPASRATRPAPQQQRPFWLETAPASNRQSDARRLNTHLRRKSERIRVYVDEQDKVSRDTTEAIVNVCEARIVSGTERHLGPIADIDGDGTLAIVLTSQLDRLEGGRMSLGGLTCAADFSTSGPSPPSNAADVVFLNANNRAGRHLETLLAHELAHAAVFSARYHRAQASIAGVIHEEDWLNEGLAHVAENLHGAGWTNLDYRLSAYLAAPE